MCYDSDSETVHTYDCLSFYLNGGSFVELIDLH